LYAGIVVAQNFELPIYEEEILDVLANETWARVTIKLRTDGEYIRNMTPGLKNTISSILETLNDSEFNLLGEYLSGRKFYGYVSKEGFDKLIQNPFIEEIYLSGVSYTLISNSSYTDQEINLSDQNTTIENDTLNDSEYIFLENDSYEEISGYEEVDDEPETHQEKSTTTWFSKLITFIKRLFGVN